MYIHELSQTLVLTSSCPVAQAEQCIPKAHVASLQPSEPPSIGSRARPTNRTSRCSDCPLRGLLRPHNTSQYHSPRVSHPRRGFSLHRRRTPRQSTARRHKLSPPNSHRRPRTDARLRGTCCHAIHIRLGIVCDLRLSSSHARSLRLVKDGTFDKRLDSDLDSDSVANSSCLPRRKYARCSVQWCSSCRPCRSYRRHTAERKIHRSPHRPRRRPATR